MKATAAELGLSRNHMTGQSWIKGTKTTTNPPRPIKDVLVYGKYESSSNLKDRLYKEGLKQKICEICKGIEWLGKPIPLALDHIDGDRLNNRIENLQILCYNCHGQTDTFCRQKDANGKSKRKPDNRTVAERIKDSNQYHTSQPLPVADTLCVICNKVCNSNLYWHKQCTLCVDCQRPCSELRCKPCAGKFREPTKINWPTNEELIEQLKTSNYSKLGRELGVSDNAIRKRLKRG